MQAVLFVMTVAVFLLMILAASRTIQKQDSIEEQEKDVPCDSCVRWSECNGVDTECPLLEEPKAAAFEVDAEQMAATMREAVEKAKLK